MTGLRKQIPLLSALFLFGALSGSAQTGKPAVKVEPKTLPAIGTVDERFQSYNVEMVEVTGGRFWKPYSSPTDQPSTQSKETSQGNQPAGLSASLFQYRPPIDLSNARLRKLAAALGPAYLRVSGTWANSTYFDPEGTKDTKPPAGFQGVLTGAEWRGVLQFAKATNAALVTSFAVSAGTRDKDGVWTPAEAEKVVAFTKAEGGKIAAAELINEPTYPEIDGLGKSYDAAAFARDIRVFRSFTEKSLPGMLVLGPGGVGEGVPMMSGQPSAQTQALLPRALPSTELLKATGPAFDVFSYHSYGAVSVRCNPGKSKSIDQAISADTLEKAALIAKFYGSLREQFDPGKPMWNTETAEAACGGDSWASEFADSFRYLKQLGDLARLGVQVNTYNTLASSDYGLLDENSYEPRPNYWAALLWRRLVERTVLDAGAQQTPNLYLYAHCLRDHPGGVAIVAINADKDSHDVDVPARSERYTLTARSLESRTVDLNSATLALAPGDRIPEMKGTAEPSGVVHLKPLSITFLSIPTAANEHCR